MLRLLLISSFVAAAGCAHQQTQAAPCDHPTHSHTHDPAESSSVAESRPAVVPHIGLKSFENNGNTLVGIATRSQGAQSFEVWRSSVAPGSSTPLHKHESEEVFIVLRGKGEVTVGDQVIAFEAPATVIAPAGVLHQLRNTGDEPTEQIVVVGVGSIIYGADGKPLNLPWRK